MGPRTRAAAPILVIGPSEHGCVDQANHATGVVCGFDQPIERQPIYALAPVETDLVRRLPDSDPTRDLHLRARPE